MFLKGYQKENLKKDLPAGILVAFVAIPISIGYAMMIGLPPEYGLYGTMLPILVFGLFASTPRFVFGVDAAPSVMTVGFLATMGIHEESEILAIVPALAFVVAVWLFIFRAVHLPKVIRFVSEPVMGGFITGLCTEIILIQFPKLFGGSPGHGTLLALVGHIEEEAAKGVHVMSLAMGLGTVLILLISRKFFPRIPMAVVLMFLSVFASMVLPLEAWGVKLLPDVPSGLPSLSIPDLSYLMDHPEEIFLNGGMIALIIMAETLLASGAYGRRFDDHLEPDRDVLACAAGNLASSLVGAFPVNGSVSQTGIINQFGVKSQMMSLAASVTLFFILLFGTGFIAYIPVPVLTGIVIAALISNMELGLACKLQNVDRAEFYIFSAVFATVLVAGTIYGVLIGMMLSFVTIIIRASDPPRGMLGYIPSQDDFFPVTFASGAREIRGIVLYRFSGALFFGNAALLEDEILEAWEQRTDTIEAIIIDASGVTSIDITATEYLLNLYEKCKKHGLRFYLTEHTSALNMQLREFGAEELFREGAVLPSIERALKASNIEEPYPLLPEKEKEGKKLHRTQSYLTDFEWAYGADAEEKLNEFVVMLADRLLTMDEFDDRLIIDAERLFFGHLPSDEDEEHFLEFLEIQLAYLAQRPETSREAVARAEARILRLHAKLDSRLAIEHPEKFRGLVAWRLALKKRFCLKHPEAAERYREESTLYYELLAEQDASLPEEIREMCREMEEELKLVETGGETR